MILDSKTGGFNKNMMGGGSIFKGIEQIKAFNAELANSNSKYRAYLNTMKEAEPWAQKVVKLNKLQAVGFRDGTKHIVSYTASLVGATIKTVALQAASMALNAALTWGVSLAIQAIVTLIQKAWELVPTIKNLQKQFDKVAEEFDSLISEEQSLNDELTTTQERIDEIKSKGKLSFTDASELKRLEQQNSLLKRSLELNQQNKKLAFDSYKNAFTNLVRGQTGKTYSSLYSWQTAIDPMTEQEYTTGDAKVISTTEYLKELVQAYKDAGEHQDEFISNTTGVHWSQEDINNKISEFGDTVTKYQDYLQKLNEQGYQYGTNDVLDKTIDDANLLIDTFMALNGSTTTLFADILGRDKFAKAQEGIENLSEISSQSLQQLYMDTKDIQGGFYDFVNYLLSLNTIDWKTVLGEDAFNKLDLDKNGIISELELFDETTGECKLSTEQWAKVMPLLSNELNKVEEAAEGAASNVKKFSDVFKSIKEGTDVLADAYSDIEDGGQISLEHLMALLDAYPDLVEYVDLENGQHNITKDILKAKFEAVKQTQLAQITASKAAVNAEISEQEAILDTIAVKKEKAKQDMAESMVSIGQFKTVGDALKAINARPGYYLRGFDWDVSDAKVAIADAEKQLKTLNAQEALIKNMSWKDITSGSGAKTGKTQAEKDFDYLKHRRELDIIDQKQYLLELYQLTNKYYKGNKDYIDEYASNMEELYDGFKSLYKEDFEAKKKSLEEQKDAVTKYYNDLIDKIKEANEQEDYEEKQSEKRKTIFELKAKIEDLLRDGSQRALAKAAELQEELADAEKELLDFEKDNARENEIKRLEKAQETEEEKIQKQIDSIDQTLSDIDDDIKSIRQTIIDYAAAFGVTITPVQQAATGTLNARGGLTRINERGLELIATPDGHGNYINMLPASKVLTAQQTATLIALSQGQLPQAMYNSIARSIGTNVNSPAVNNYNQPITIQMGDIIIQGNADKQTVSSIKKQQEDMVRVILEKIKELQG